MVKVRNEKCQQSLFMHPKWSSYATVSGLQGHPGYHTPENSTTVTERGESRRMIANSSTVTTGTAWAGSFNENIVDKAAAPQDAKIFLLLGDIPSMPSLSRSDSEFKARNCVSERTECLFDDVVDGVSENTWLDKARKEATNINSLTMLLQTLHGSIEVFDSAIISSSPMCLAKERGLRSQCSNRFLGYSRCFASLLETAKGRNEQDSKEKGCSVEWDACCCCWKRRRTKNDIIITVLLIVVVQARFILLDVVGLSFFVLHVVSSSIRVSCMTIDSFHVLVC